MEEGRHLGGLCFAAHNLLGRSCLGRQRLMGKHICSFKIFPFSLPQRLRKRSGVFSLVCAWLCVAVYLRMEFLDETSQGLWRHSVSSYIPVSHHTGLFVVLCCQHEVISFFAFPCVPRICWNVTISVLLKLSQGCCCTQLSKRCAVLLVVTRNILCFHKITSTLGKHLLF